MKTLVLAVLLAAMQAAPPVPRKAASHAADAPNRVQGNPSSNQTPAARPPTPVEPTATQPEGNPASSPQSGDKRQDIRVVELPPVSVRRDVADWGYWAFSGLLVVVGFLQVWLLRGTLRAARDNAKAASKNAEATNNAVTAMHEANRFSLELGQAVQRAYITFPILDIQSLAIKNELESFLKWEFRVGVENSGNTPARELVMQVYWIWRPGKDGLVEDFGFPEPRPSDKFLSSLPAKGKTYSPKLTIEHGIVRAAYEGRGRLYFYGWATYKDVFDKTPIHRTEFCHEISVLKIKAAESGLLLEVSTHRQHNSQT